MKRANTFAVRPLTHDDERVLRDLLDASAALWNEIKVQPNGVEYQAASARSVSALAPQTLTRSSRYSH